MKKIALLISILTLAGASVWGMMLYQKNFKGVWPAVKKPPQDIAKILEKSAQAPPNGAGMPLALPPGFSISIFAKDLVNPRVIVFDPQGNLLASIPSEGRVVALPDSDKDGIADEIITVKDGLNRPHGLAFREGKLYLAESDKVVMYEYDAQKFKARNGQKILDLPDGENHFTRTILFINAPEGEKLLISVGSSCNVCREKDWRRAKILISDPDGKNVQVFASGLRNAVFMAVHPLTGKIWATEMGRDLLGDNLPPDEINIVQEGKDYGWPYCYGKNIPDPFGKSLPISFCLAKEPSHIDIQAHSAPLGLAFFPVNGWPQEYWYNLLVAYHGSWNRTTPTGYKVVRYRLDAQGNYLDTEDFISGWLTPSGALGRPVDILIQPDGTIYISDDKAGVIYRLVFHE